MTINEREKRDRTIPSSLKQTRAPHIVPCYCVQLRRQFTVIDCLLKKKFCFTRRRSLRFGRLPRFTRSTCFYDDFDNVVIYRPTE